MLPELTAPPSGKRCAHLDLLQMHPHGIKYPKSRWNIDSICVHWHDKVWCVSVWLYSLQQVSLLPLVLQKDIEKINLITNEMHIIPNLFLNITLINSDVNSGISLSPSDLAVFFHCLFLFLKDLSYHFRSTTELRSCSF